MEEVQSIANRRRADDFPRVAALDLLRHNGVVPVRSQTLACGGDVLRATCVRVSLPVAPGRRAVAVRFVAFALALGIYKHSKCTGLGPVSRIRSRLCDLTTYLCTFA